MNIIEFAPLCRICLGKNAQMYPLNYSFNEAADCMDNENRDEDIAIHEVLSTVLYYTEPVSEKYPQNICSMCLGILKIAYDFKVLFEESHRVILQCIGGVEIPKDNLVDSEENEKKSNFPVELIAGPNKYDLKDLVIVEQENCTEEINFRGFLKNLGTSISATFAGNPNDRQDNCSPVLELIEHRKESSKQNYSIAETQEINDCYDSEPPVKRNGLSSFDQYIIVEGDDIDGTIIHVTDLDTENVEMVNDDLITPALFLKYECAVCKQIYSSKSKYQNHVGICGNQNKLRDNLEDIDEDLIQSAVNMKYECRVCKRVYSSNTRYQKHIDTCGKQYKLVRDNHGEPAVVSKFQCEYCSKSFKDLKFFNYHVKGHKIPLFPCEICNQKFKTRSSRNYHRTTRHSELKYVCQFCGKKFATSGSLNVHVQTHDKTKAQCICPVCGKTFHYKGGLFYHMKQHTNERKYECNYCEKRFYTITAKKRHILTHTGVRAYECQYCQKRFFSRGELTKHEYVHTGVLPYKCKYCDKGFTSSFNMKVHWSNHPGSFLCDYCSRGFITREVLQFHLNMKHKDMLKKKEDSS